MKIKVLDADTLGSDLDLSPLSEVGEVSVYGGTAAAELPTRLSDAEVILLNKIKIDEVALDAAPKLRLICVLATGYDNIDVPACRARGVAVCNVRGYSTDSVAQVTLSMALSLATHLAEYRQSVDSGAYTGGGVANRLTPVYHELAGKCWGIIGYGNIGKKVAAVAEAIGCRVLACRRNPEANDGTVSLDTLLREADIISIHTPLSDSTRRLVDAAAIEKMKDGVILINVARGAVTDEAALAAAVLSGKIGALGVDVYTAEPMPKDHPFQAILGRPNVCLTPHMAWGAYEARVRCLAESIANIEAFYGGRRRNRVDGE